MANLAIGIENVKGRDIARKFWINLDSKIKRMWNARAQNFKKVHVVYAEKASVIPTLAQLPVNLVNANHSFVMFQTIILDWKFLVARLRKQMKLVRKKDCFIREKMPKDIQVLRKVYFKERISLLLYVALFGGNLCKLHSHEIVERGRGIDYIHLISRERVEALFTLEGESAAILENHGMRHELRARACLKDKRGVYYKSYIEEASDEYMSVRLYDECFSLLVLPIQNSLYRSLYDITNIEPVRIRYDHNSMVLTIVTPSICTQVKNEKLSFVPEYCL